MTRTNLTLAEVDRIQAALLERRRQGMTKLKVARNIEEHLNPNGPLSFYRTERFNERRRAG